MKRTTYPNKNNQYSNNNNSFSSPKNKSFVGQSYQYPNNQIPMSQMNQGQYQKKIKKPKNKNPQISNNQILNINDHNDKPIKFEHQSYYRNKKIFYIIIAITVIVIATFLSLLFTINGGVQNGYVKQFDISQGTFDSQRSQELIDTVDRYYLQSPTGDFENKFEEMIVKIINDSISLSNNNKPLTTDDLWVDWTMVSFDKPGDYWVKFSSVRGDVIGSYEQPITVLDYPEINLADVVFAGSMLEINPYVTTDNLRYEDNVPVTIIDIVDNWIENETGTRGNIKNADINISFSNNNPNLKGDDLNHLDLTKAYDSDTESTGYNSVIHLKASGHNDGIIGSQDILIQPKPYDLSNELFFYEDVASANNESGDKTSGHIRADKRDYNYNTLYYKFVEYYSYDDFDHMKIDKILSDEISDFNWIFNTNFGDQQETAYVPFGMNYVDIDGNPINSATDLLDLSDFPKTDNPDTWNYVRNEDFWKKYKVTAKQGNGVFTGSFNRHLKFYI